MIYKLIWSADKINFARSRICLSEASWSVRPPRITHGDSSHGTTLQACPFLSSLRPHWPQQHKLLSALPTSWQQNSITSHIPWEFATACHLQPHFLDNHTMWGGPQWNNPISCQQHRCDIACLSPIGPINPHRYPVQGSIPSPWQDHSSGFHCQQTPSQCTGARLKCKHHSHPCQQFSHQHQQVCWCQIHRHLRQQRGQLLREGHH